jgi:alpha-ribazole phosphatase
MTNWTAEKRYQGYSDTPLNAEGTAQAQRLAVRFTAERLQSVISSDLVRASATAEAIAARHDLAVVRDPDWRETHFGLFEGLRYKDVIEQYAAHAKAWFDDPEQPPPGGEKLSETVIRVQRALTALQAKYANRRVALVGHGGALRITLCLLLGMLPGEYWRFNVDPASVSQVNLYPGGAILIRLNDVSHLERRS